MLALKIGIAPGAQNSTTRDPDGQAGVIFHKIAPCACGRFPLVVPRYREFLTLRLTLATGKNPGFPWLLTF